MAPGEAFVGYYRPKVETEDGKITDQSGVANTPVKKPQEQQDGTKQ